MKYTLGIDLGITSVGWAVINNDLNRIEDLGVRTFAAAEDPKTRAPLAEPRRLARSARLRLRRRGQRLHKIKALFVQYRLIPPEFNADVFVTESGKATPWELRVKGLDELLSGEELARSLFHIAKRRGYKSNRRSEADKKEEGAVTAAIKANAVLLAEKGYRTIGELFASAETFQDRKRNRSGDYAHCVDRDSLLHEIQTLFQQQRELGSALACTELQAEFEKLFSWQLPFASGDDILSKVGSCTFEKSEKRAAKNCYTAERFTLLKNINHLSWYADGVKTLPSDTQRKIIIAAAYDKCKLTFKDLRKLLKLGPDVCFTGLDYRKEAAKCETRVFCNLEGYRECRRIAEEAGEWIDIQNAPDAIDDLAHALTFYKSEEDVVRFLAEKQFTESLCRAAAASAGFRKPIHLSLRAMKKIIPFLEEGLVYSEACELAGYDHSNAANNGEKFRKLPPIPSDDVRNPVACRALTQARKVINAVIEKHGSPASIHIELAREMGKGAELRKKIERQIEDNRKANAAYDLLLADEFGHTPMGDDRIKMRFYKGQNCKCAYSLKTIDITRLFEPGYVQIDHIVPYSRSFDDSMANRVLVLTSENQNKANRTPYEYFGHDEERWQQFLAWVQNTPGIDQRKKAKLTTTESADVERQQWMPRNLIDTQYISSLMADHIRRNLLFSDPANKLPVICVSGRITSLLRGMWGISKVRADNDLHHAKDAVVIACISQRMIGLITRYRQQRERARWQPGQKFVDTETGEIIDFKFSFPLPWAGFRRELDARLLDDPEAALAVLNLPSYADGMVPPAVFVSRKSDRKASGPLHKETIRSLRQYPDGTKKVVSRIQLTDLKLSDLDRLYAPETNEKLYAAIKERLIACGGNAKKAFEDTPLRKPTKDGIPGPIVRAVKVAETNFSGVQIRPSRPRRVELPDIQITNPDDVQSRTGLAENGDMVRVDIFQKNNKFYIVPIYTWDIAARSLPNKAIVPGVQEDYWIEMEDSFEFVYSLHSYELVNILDSKGTTRFGYYRGCDRSTNAINISVPNTNELIRGIGVRTAKNIEKFEVGILGDYHPVSKETRRGMANGCDRESGEADGQK